ncbi:MAG: acyltransferase [Erythrobacter sp.]
MKKQNLLRRLLQAAIRQAKGIEIRIDPEIRNSELVMLALRQATALLRGLVIWRGPVYLEPGVILRQRSRIRIGRFSKIGTGTLIEGLSRDGIEIGAGVSLGRYGRMSATGSLAELGRGVRLEDYVGIGDFFYLGAYGGIRIDTETIVGPHLYVHSDNHDFDDPAISIRRQSVTEEPVRIGARCWLGSNVTILGGVEIGDDCVVGAGAVVTKSFPAGSVIVGNPARVIGTRPVPCEGNRE